jgi:hypothetical protein
VIAVVVVEMSTMAHFEAKILFYSLFLLTTTDSCFLPGPAPKLAKPPNQTYFLESCIGLFEPARKTAPTEWGEKYLHCKCYSIVVPEYARLEKISLYAPFETFITRFKVIGYNRCATFHPTSWGRFCEPVRISLYTTRENKFGLVV